MDTLTDDWKAKVAEHGRLLERIVEATHKRDLGLGEVMARKASKMLGDALTLAEGRLLSIGVANGQRDEARAQRDKAEAEAEALREAIRNHRQCVGSLEQSGWAGSAFDEALWAIVP